MRANITIARDCSVVTLLLLLPQSAFAYHIGINPEEDIFIRCLNGECRSTDGSISDDDSFIVDPFDYDIFGTDLGIMTCGEQRCYMVFGDTDCIKANLEDGCAADILHTDICLDRWRCITGDSGCDPENPDTWEGPVCPCPYFDGSPDPYFRFQDNAEFNLFIRSDINNPGYSVLLQKNFNPLFDYIFNPLDTRWNVPTGAFTKYETLSTYPPIEDDKLYVYYAYNMTSGYDIAQLFSSEDEDYKFVLQLDNISAGPLVDGRATNWCRSKRPAMCIDNTMTCPGGYEWICPGVEDIDLFKEGKFINIAAVKINTDASNTVVMDKEDTCKLPNSDPALLLYGTGKYRDSAIYLAWVPLDSVEVKGEYRYWSKTSDKDCWNNDEKLASPIALELWENPKDGIKYIHDESRWDNVIVGAGEISAILVNIDRLPITKPVIFISATTDIGPNVYFYTPEGRPWQLEMIDTAPDLTDEERNAFWADNCVMCNEDSESHGPSIREKMWFKSRCYNDPDVDREPGQDPYCPQCSYGQYFAPGMANVTSEGVFGSIELYHVASTWCGNNKVTRERMMPYSVESRKMTLSYALEARSIWEWYATSRASSMREPVPGYGPLTRFELLMNTIDAMSLSWISEPENGMNSWRGIAMGNYEPQSDEWTREWGVAMKDASGSWLEEMNSLRNGVLSQVAAEECSNPMPNEGCRSMGANIKAAVDSQQESGFKDRSVVVLVDGQDDMTATPGYETTWGVLEGYSQFQSSSPDTKYHVIAMGPGTNDRELYDLTTFSEGSFHKSSNIVDLPSIIQVVEAEINGMSAVETSIDGEGYHVFEVSNHDDAIIITMMTNTTTDPLGRDITAISPPDAFEQRLVASTADAEERENVSVARSDGAVVMNIRRPRPGLWKVYETMGGQIVSPSQGSERVFGVSARSTISLDARPIYRQNYIGEIVPIRIEYLDRGEAISNANFDVNVIYSSSGQGNDVFLDVVEDTIPTGNITVEPDPNGGYTLSFLAQSAGTYSVVLTGKFIQLGKEIARKERLSLVVIPFDPSAEVDDTPGDGSIISVLDTELPADGISSTEVMVRLENFLGEGLPGRHVFFTTTHGSFIGTVADNGDGTYSQTFVAGTEAGEARIGAAAAQGSGESMFRLSDLATVTLAPGIPDPTRASISLRSGLDFLYLGKSDRLQVQLLDANGNTVSCGHDVEFTLSGGSGASMVGAVECIGNGTYEQEIVAPVSYTSVVVGARVNGASVQAESIFPVLDHPPGESDCNDDGLPEPLHGHPCSTDTEWWALVGANVCDFDSGMLVCDASPADRIDGGWYPYPGVKDFDVGGEYVYVARGQRLEVLEPGGACIGPRRVGSVQLDSLALDVEVAGDHVYVGTFKGVSILDITVPTAPWVAGDIQSRFPIVSVEVRGNRLYTVDGYTLRAYEIVEPEDPVVFSEADIFECRNPGLCFLRAIAGYSHPLAVDSEIAVVGDNEKLVVVDVGNPFEMTVVSSYATAGRIKGVKLVRSHAYISGDSVSDVVDLRIPSQPSRLADHDLDGWVTGTAHIGSFAYRVVGGFLEEAEILIASI